MGGITPNGKADLVDAAQGTFGGQVGAPCGCIGNFDTFENIAGNLTYSRKPPGTGSLHATDFNSLVCGCTDQVPPNGNLCNDKNRDTGPFPPGAPADEVCFSGVGDFSPDSGPKTVEVAFRVEAVDTSQPGGGNNSGPTPSVFRIRIWIPTGNETAEGLAKEAACTGPLGNNLCTPTLRAPNIDDGLGGLLHGAIQVHPQIPSHTDVCPVPDVTCPASGKCPAP